VSCASASPAAAIATTAAASPTSLRINHPLLNILVGRHSIVPDASVQEECRMTALPDCLLIVTAEVDASVEADWNRWYDDVHLPDALACPGVRAGRRYVSSGEVSERDRGQGKRTGAKLYTTVYELDSPAAVETREFKAMRGWSRFSPHIRSQTRVVVAVR
jgi:hypothetical protein